jgi:hypothetical protein
MHGLTRLSGFRKVSVIKIMIKVAVVDMLNGNN